MQNSLLGFAIGVILALVAALVGPRLIDWTQYRSEFETSASRMIGLQVRASGDIDLQLLPTPSMTLTQFEIARPGSAGAVRARKVSIEFELGALLRGEWRAANVRLEGANFGFGLDSFGRLDLPALVTGADAEGLSIQRLEVVDGRALFADASSGTQTLIDKLEFGGELRSLLGPLKGEGSFSVGGDKYPYRISVGRLGDDGALRMHLNVEPVNRPLAEADGQLWLDQGIPRYEGSLSLLRPVRAAPADGGIVEPWRLTSKFKGDSATALLEQLEFQYGPDDRAVKLRGDGRFVFGRQPQLTGALSSSQIDLDRLLDLPEATRKRPMIALRNFADYFTGLQKPSIPVKFGVTVEQVTLAGALLQRVAGDISSDGENWDVESLQLRAPGATQFAISGRLAMSRDAISFAGPARIEAGNARALSAWLIDRTDVQVAPGPLRAEGEVAFGGGAFSVERLKAEIDRTTIDGRLAYRWPSGDRPARIEAALSTPDIDLERAFALLQGAAAEASLPWPHEGALALKFARATLADLEAKRADAKVQFSPSALTIEEFSLGDFGGATLAAKGRIDQPLSSPRGNVTLDLTARSLDGVVALLEKVSPVAAEQVRIGAARFLPAKLNAALAVDAEVGAPGGRPLAKLGVEGVAGIYKINLQGDAGSTGDRFTIEQIAQLLLGKMNLAGRVEASDGSALVELLTLDRLVAVDKRPARFTFTTGGMMGGDFSVDGQIVAGGLEAAARGSLRIAGQERPSGTLELKLASGNLRLPRMLAGARLGQTASVAALTARAALTQNEIALTDVSGKLAGSDLKGQLKFTLAPTLRVDGELDLGQLNLPATLGAAIGAPTAPSNGAWPTDPFEPGVLGSLGGQVTIKAARVTLTPKLAARDMRAVVKLADSELTLEQVDGVLAGGRVTGDVTFAQSPEGLSAHGRIQLASGDIAELTPGDARPLSGRVTVDVNFDGTGRSPVALVGALSGGGSFRWQDGRLVRFDPFAFEVVTRGVDQGLPLDPERIRDRTEVALANGALPVPMVEGDLTISNGQVRLSNPSVRTERGRVSPSGRIDLADHAIDGRLLFTGPEIAGAPDGSRPELTVALKGPLDAPRRTLDVTSFASWLALRAVEQQARRVQAMETAGEAQSVPTGQIAPAPLVPPVTASPTSPPAISAPRSISRSVPDAPVPRPRAAPLDIRPAQN